MKEKTFRFLLSDYGRSVKARELFRGQAFWLPDKEVCVVQNVNQEGVRAVQVTGKNAGISILLDPGDDHISVVGERGVLETILWLRE